ncbi:LysR family transcriptional regulator [Streptomyces sp. NPDC051684]|uniref:LysR family transcriptional regulator n=1 Tax=Streptomyces sp. NPDC051684 TaxID=3365670 RepID=UPI0037AD6880
MELRQLRYVVAIAEEGSFTAAAARVHVAQPGLSAQIGALERELGQKLFRRGRHGAALTEVGRAVLEHARETFAAAERIRFTADEYAGLLRGEVRVGLVSGAATDEFDIARVLAEFRHDHPQVRVSLSEHSSEEMLTAIVNGGLDIAVVGLTGAELPAAVATDTILETGIVAAVAEDDDRLPRDGIPLADLAHEHLICLPHGTGIRGVLQRACDAADITADVVYEAASPPVLLRIAARGLGVAVVPELTPDEAAAFHVRTAPITHPSLRGKLALAWDNRGGRTPAVNVLLGQLRIAFGAAETRGPR